MQSVRTVTRAVNSVLEKRFDSYELIAIDDGSTDGSFKIIDNYGDRLKVLR
jgi:dolichol-phosphate mannosyltransferase